LYGPRQALGDVAHIAVHGPGAELARGTGGTVRVQALGQTLEGRLGQSDAGQMRAR